MSVQTHINSSIDQHLQQDVMLAQQGNIQAYERLITASQNLVTSIALAIVKDVDDSEEIAQQVFVSVWQNINKLKNANSFLPWIRQSTRYTAYNFMRNNKSKHRLDSQQADELLEQLIDPQISNDDSLIQDNKNAILQGFIDKLASDEREIVLLYYREEQSSKQVAQLLNLTEANVRKKLSRVRQSLKADLLSKAQTCIYSTAPTIGFSALVTSLLAPSSPVMAASLSGSVAGTSASSNILVKVVAVLGGSLLGAFLAVFAIVWSSNIAMKTIESSDNKRILKRYRNETIAWVVAWGFIITAGYEFTDGWQGPVFTYLGFAIGLVALMYRSMAFIHAHSVQNKDGLKIKASNGRKCFDYAFLLIGVTVGFAGLIIGLFGSGRL